MAISLCFDKNVKIRGKKRRRSIPTGTLEMANKSLTLHTERSCSRANSGRQRGIHHG